MFGTIRDNYPVTELHTLSNRSKKVTACRLGITGFIGQNVYLFCASEGLASVFRAAVEYAKLARLMRLPEQQFVTFAQTVGYPRG